MRTSERTVFEAIRFLACDPEIVSMEEPTSILITVEPFRGRYRICEQGNNATEVFGLTTLVEHLNYRVTLLSLLAKPHAAILHAALLRRGDRRVLLVGRAAAGKTTLALRLIQAGYDLEGDEHAFLEPDGITARPRACRVKEPSLAFLPDLAESISLAPVYIDYAGRKLFNVEPRLVRGSWRIEKGQVGHVVVLQPNHNGYSSLRRLPPLALSEALISELGLREGGRSASIAALAGLANMAKGYDLSLGDHETAIRCINRAIDD
jgi:hypothetical protein